MDASDTFTSIVVGMIMTALFIVLLAQCPINEQAAQIRKNTQQCARILKHSPEAVKEAVMKDLVLDMVKRGGDND